MSFNSLAFATFVAAVATGFYLIPRRIQRWYLLLVSVGFYATYGIPHAGILLGATTLATFCAAQIARPSQTHQQRYLVIGVGGLLGLLAAFKYLPALDLPLPVRLVAPIGISYYTFKLISYVVDVYWGKVKPERWLTVCSFSAFFPHILSGPIQRPGDFFTQSEPDRPVRGVLVVSGLRLILFGCFKKMVVADRLAMVVDKVFAAPGNYSDGLVAVACYLFPIQLYADFSGFSDIAIGVGRLFGISGPKNFDSPFYSSTIQAFWRRWHISLTSWLTDYVFTPLRMALRNHGRAGLVISIGATMVAIGVWHGPRWTYLTFGVINAIYMVTAALTSRWRDRFFRRVGPWTIWRAWLRPLSVFHLMLIAFVFFRAESMSDAGQVLRRLPWGISQLLATGWARLAGAGPTSSNRPFFEFIWTRKDIFVLLPSLVVMETVHILQTRGKLTSALTRMPIGLRWLAYYLLLAVTFLWASTGVQQFIYFKF